MKISENNRNMTIAFQGEFDNYTITQIKQECIDLIEEKKPKKVCLDFKEVSFIDSTGIGFILGRYKQCSRMNCELTLKNLSRQHRSLLAMSGLFQLINEERDEGVL